MKTGINPEGSVTAHRPAHPGYRSQGEFSA